VARKIVGVAELTIEGRIETGRGMEVTERWREGSETTEQGENKGSQAEGKQNWQFECMTEDKKQKKE